MSDKEEILVPSQAEDESSKSSNDDQSLVGPDGIAEPTKNNDDVKKAAANLINKYYILLRNGCGSYSCCNPNCFSSGQVGSLSSDAAAVRALELFTEKAKLCENFVTMPAGINTNLSDTSLVVNPIERSNEFSNESANDRDTCLTLHKKGSRSVPWSCSFKNSTNFASDNDNCGGLTEQRLQTTINECILKNNYASLRILLRTIFSNVSTLKYSFLVSDLTSKHVNKEVISITQKQLGSDTKNCTKEELRAAEKDLDKDVDCQENRQLIEVDCIKSLKVTPESKPQPNITISKSEKDSSLSTKSVKIDLESLRRSYDMLYKVPETEFSSTLMDAILNLLRDNLAIQLKVFPTNFKTDLLLINIFIILLENPNLCSTDFTEEVLGDLCKVIAQLGIDHQVILVKHIAQWETERIHRFLQSLHQLITIQLLQTEFSRDFTINDEDTITSATRVMKIVYYVSIYKGQLDSPLLKNLVTPKPPPWDTLGKALGIHSLDVKEPAIPLEEFYDDFLSDQLEMDRDFAYFKAGVTDQFSFLNYPFILTPATKALGLYYDNRIRMYSERRISIFQTVMEGTHVNPYLNLRIRRDHIIEDALVELELVSTENPGDLKKQLVVEFEGEQGIDEGGVSKEFFQLIVEQIFNPDYAMFCFNKETETFWFNPTSFESEGQFILVGIVLGLAIYNNVILDLHFPSVMYKKLCGKPGSFLDLKEWNMTLYKSLKELLDYEGEDMADVFMQTFRVGYHDIFGASLFHDLKLDGDNIFVTQENKREFVEKYTDFLMNKSVELQFTAFKKGFAMVTDDSPLEHLFRPDELELLVCGSQHYDFLELRKSTEYDGGYNADSQIITWFWDLVDEMKPDEKKQLLQFTTGSARVPVGGLARLKLIIARHGPDSERLPTAHTCFNVLLLPEYSSKEKLNERLLKAITYAQGFGML